MKKKPIIGISADSVIKVEGEQGIPDAYIDSVVRAGGIPFIIPILTNENDLKRLIDLCDGFILSGGQDISPFYYNEDVTKYCGPIYHNRDESDFKLFELIFNTNKPILGICRGFQLINVALGGSLYQDEFEQRNVKEPVKHKQTENFDKPVHTIEIIENSKLHSIFNKNKIDVNSIHHQGIKVLGKSLVEQAFSRDGLIEAISIEGERFVLGVQWHPEYLIDTEHLLLFKALVENA